MVNARNELIAKLRQKALSAFAAGVTAADPVVALTKAFETNPLPTLGFEGKYIVVAAGKAACKMADCALKGLPKGADYIAIAVTNRENEIAVKGCKVIASSHPIPCEKGLQAGREVISMLESARDEDVVIMLVSGGSSALLPAPTLNISLQDKMQTNEVLLASGFDIYEMNLVRQSLSRLKGGGVLRFAYPAQVWSYILSDVVGDDLRVVGSGPSVGPLGNKAAARRLLIETGNYMRLPASVRFELDKTDKQTKPIRADQAYLIAGNANSVQAMALVADAIVIETPLIGDVQRAAETVLATVKPYIGKGPFAIAFGGETTVKLAGKGKGGRNQELALRVACEATAAGFLEPWCFLSGGTDGRDGPTDAAGGIVDNLTLSRFDAGGEHIQSFLNNNDSYNGLSVSGDLLVTGATGTNVADLQIFIGQ